MSQQQSAQPAPFPVTTGRERGYDRQRVDAFLTRARSAFEGANESTRRDQVTSRTIRQTSFPLTKRGYSIAAVDSALARVEDAFATRERERAVDAGGADLWLEKSRDEAQILLARVTRPKGARFRRVVWPNWGYDIEEVDRVADRVAGYIRDGRPLAAEQVRQVAFRMRRRGYREDQVDEVLDAVIDLLLAVAN